MRAARLFLLLLFASASPALPAAAAAVAAILVSGSRYWFNYRHTSNALVYYRALRRFGVRDDAIALFLPEEHACDARNAGAGARGTVHAAEGGPSGSAPGGGLLPGGGACAAPAEVDFSGAEASAEALLRLLAGRRPVGAPGGGGLPALGGGGGSGRAPARLLLLLTGHGGDGYLKFHDRDELSYEDLAAALRDAHDAGRVGELLVVADTCQAASVAAALRAAGLPRAAVVVSSAVGENSYSAGLDDALAVPLVDAFSRGVDGVLRRAAAAGAAAAAAEASGGGRRRAAALGALCASGGGGGGGGGVLSPAALASACKEVAAATSAGAARAATGWADGLAALRGAAALRAAAAAGAPPPATLRDLVLPPGLVMGSTVTLEAGDGAAGGAEAAAAAQRPLLDFFLGGAAHVEVR
jgi:phosphatidylinositol glycan class K